MADAKRTDPELWERVKKEITAGSKGGRKGQWSARKAQMAVQEYKKRGGGYADDGPGQDDTSLHEWTEEDWGTRSGKESGASGERYLPKKVRMLLTEDEYARSTRKKKLDTKKDGEQFSSQPKDVRKKVAKIKKDGPTKKMLKKRARDLDIEGVSDMSKKKLLKRIEKATNKDGRARSNGGGSKKLSSRPKSELYAMAKERGVDGRSSMSKDELVRALSG